MSDINHKNWVSNNYHIALQNCAVYLIMYAVYKINEIRKRGVS